jgi:hypothetical protein
VTDPIHETQAFADSLVGVAEAEAERVAGERGCGWRVGVRDGESFPVTMDYRPDRITVTIVDGVVTAALAG